MAIFVEVGTHIINLDTVTTIELDAQPTSDASIEAERVVRIHFNAPIIQLSAAATPPTTVTIQTLEVTGAEAELLRQYLAFEADNAAQALDGP